MVTVSISSSPPISSRNQSAVAVFLFLAYGLLWVVEIPAALFKYHVIHSRVPQSLHILDQFSPAIAALLTASIFDGRECVKALFRSVARFRVRGGWYAFAMLVPLLIEGAILLAYGVAGHALPALDDSWQAPFAIVLMTPFFVGEELGWRGYLLDRLLRRHSPMVASLWVAGCWGLWHLPVYLARDDGLQFIMFMGGMIPVSAIFTLLYWRTRSVLLCMLLHSSFDIGAAYLIGPLPDSNWVFAGLCVASWIAAIPVLAILAREHGIQPVQFK